MSLNVNFEKRLGKVTFVRNENEFVVDICAANCLGAFIYKYEEDGKLYHTLQAFFSDEDHMRNCLDGNGHLLGCEWKDIELNMFYDECKKMLPIFLQNGNTVKCYFESDGEADDDDIRYHCYDARTRMREAVEDVQKHIEELVKACGGEVIIDDECYDGPCMPGYGYIYSLIWNEEREQVYVKYSKDDNMDDDDAELAALGYLGSSWLDDIVYYAVKYYEKLNENK